MNALGLSTRLVIDDDLVLAECEEGHAAELFAQIDQNRAHLRAWLPWLDRVQQVDDSLRFIQRQIHLRNERQELVLGIFYQGRLAGCIATHAIDWSHRKTTLGYWLGKEFSGKGLMLRSCGRLLEYLFNEVRLHRVGIHCATGNHRSRRVAEQLGFRQEGTLRDHEWLYDHFVDQVIYGMLETEFRSPSEPSQ